MHGVIGDADDGELGTSEGLVDNGMADDAAGDEERVEKDNEGSEEGGEENEEFESESSEEDGDNSEEEMYAPTDEERARMRTERRTVDDEMVDLVEEEGDELGDGGGVGGRKRSRGDGEGGTKQRGGPKGGGGGQKGKGKGGRGRGSGGSGFRVGGGSGLGSQPMPGPSNPSAATHAPTPTATPTQAVKGKIPRCFERHVPDRPDKKRRCRKCNKWISFAGGTNSTGEGHMMSRHRAQWDIWVRKWKAGEIGPNDYFPEGGYGTGEVPEGRSPWMGSQTWSAPPPVHGASSGQQPMTAYYGERFDKNALQQALIEFVVETDQPFSVVEHPTFLQLMVTANRQCGEERVIPTSTTLTRQLMRLAKLAQERLKAELHAEGVGAVAMTHDIWTGADHRAYMAVTGHCLTDDFELRQVTLDFRVLPAEHTAEKIVEVLEGVVRDWELEGRSIAMTTDNASSNVAAMKYLCRGGPGDRQPRLFSSGMHVRCLAHICDLAVQLALKKVTEIAQLLALLRELASFIGYSPKRTGAFEGIQREENQREPTRAILRLRLDSENRWALTRGTLHIPLVPPSHLNPFQNQQHCNAKDAAQLQGLQITDDMWKGLKELATFLQPFHAVTLAAEGSTYPTINRVVPQFNELLDELERMRDSTTTPPSQVLLGCIEAALGKLAEYYDGSSDELMIATFLDPSFKLGYFELPVDEEGREDGGGTREGGEGEPASTTSHIDAGKVLATVRAAYRPYLEKARQAREMAEGREGSVRVGGQRALASTSSRAVGSSSRGGRGLGTNAFGGQDGDCRGLVARLATYRDRQAPAVTDEIQIYLGERLESLDTDPLAFWRRRTDLVGLRAMALDYLAIPATSAASERLFSQGRNLLHWQRHRLGPERMRACMILESFFDLHPGCQLWKTAKVCLEKAENEAVGLETEDVV
ncbi:unnamed protein product [Closterium sp. Yama58-4]|nr:unnamed protein product [Closterium sp. Yama58-4]